MEEGFIYRYLAGIEYSGYLQIPLIPLGRWLMGAALVLFVTGIRLSGKRNIMLWEMVRFGSRKRWWNARFWNAFLAGMAWCILYMLFMRVLDFLPGQQSPGGMEKIRILLLWLVHMMTLVSIFCLLDVMEIRRAAPVLILMTEVSTFTIGYFCWRAAKFMFGNWGMYMQSNAVDAVYGFSPAPVLFLECLLIILAWQAGEVLLRGRSGGICQYGYGDSAPGVSGYENRVLQASGRSR